MAATRTSTATRHWCPDEAHPIFQSVCSAASAPLIEIFMWMNCDLSCETAVAVQMCFPIKSSLQKLFLRRSEATLFNQKEAVPTPRKLAVIFHL